MKFLRSWAVAVALIASAVGSAALTTQPANAASSDPCLSSGYVRTAWGDVGAAGWYRNPNYNVDYFNDSRWGLSNGVDHNLQWEMTYQSSSRTAQFCVRNLKAIGRTATKITSDLYQSNGACISTPLVPARSVPAGAGWVSLIHSYLPKGGSYEVHFVDYWAGGRTHGWSNPSLNSFPICSPQASSAATRPVRLAAPTPSGC